MTRRQRTCMSSAQWWLAVAVLLAVAPTVWADTDTEYFERNVRPLFAERCVSCHGPKKQESGLRLDVRVSALKGGVSGPVIVARKPGESPLIAAVKRDGEIEMPPDDPLPEAEVAVLVKWIEMGAPWPRDATDSSPRSGGITDEDRQFWSFQPVADPPPPEVSNAGWCQSPIDRFILARIEAVGLLPAKPADRRSLIRRATFDLTGLPPMPEDVAAFVKDSSPDAFARLVDELLASPAYGERWGRHWLDVVRYCDSRDARHTGQPYDVNEAWRYRDWVVESLNRDQSYDEFVRLQIAGDYAPASDSEQDAIEGLIASGMLVIGEWGSGDADAKKMYTDIVDDQIHVVSQTFMGISLTCARCHDHKFDPFSTRDYYSLAGIFFSTQIATPGTDAPLMRQPLLTASERKRREQIRNSIAELEQELKQFNEHYVDEIRQQVVSQTSQYLIALWQFERDRPSPLFSTSATLAEIVEFCNEHDLNPALFTVWRNTMRRLADDGELLTVAAPDYVAPGVFTWKSPNTQPLCHVNTTDDAAVLPGMIPPRSVAVHPTPTTGVAMTWRSPIDGDVLVTSRVSDAHVGGNGVEWTLEHHQGIRGNLLAAGAFDAGGSSPPSDTRLSVGAGDVVRLVILPRDNNHTCDLTHLQLQIAEVGGNHRVWSPQRDIVPNPELGNPRADAYGNSDVWSFAHLPRRVDLESAPFDRLTRLAPWFDAMQERAHDRVIETANSIQVALDATSTSARTSGTPTWKLLTWLTAGDGLLKGDAVLALDGDAKARRDRLTSELDKQRKQLTTTDVTLAAKEGGVPGTVHAGFNDARVHVRGDYNRLGGVVPRGVPAILAGDAPPTISSGSGRAELSDWITRSDHPLTPRVMVNRIWMHHFGDGLVRTPGDFGTQGERPTHPLLLDWLATRFVESGWSIKAMHRAMMLSATYQQSAVHEDQASDPDNRLFARMTSRRLEVEAIRDTLLAVSGRLDRRMRGPSAPRYPAGYSRAERKPANFSSTRRTLYLMTIRGEYSDGPFVLDAANANRLVHQRTVSTTAPQALLLLNDPFVRSLAKSLSERLLALDVAATPDRINAVYELLFARPAESRELAAGMDFLAAIDNESLAWEQYCHALMCSNELIYRN